MAKAKSLGFWDRSEKVIPIILTILFWVVAIPVGCSFMTTRQSEIRMTSVTRTAESPAMGMRTTTGTPSISHDPWDARRLKNTELTKGMIAGAQYVLRDHFKKFPECVGNDFTSCGEGAAYPIIVEGQRLVARMDHHTNGGDKLGVTLYRPQ